MTTSSGRFRNNESFIGMIENLGDAYEAAEECFGMVQVLARALETAATVQVPVRSREEWIEWAVNNYQQGLEIGKVQRPR